MLQSETSFSIRTGLHLGSKAGPEKRGMRWQKQPAFVRFAFDCEYRANGIFQACKVEEKWILTKTIGRRVEFGAGMKQQDSIVKLIGGPGSASRKVSTLSDGQKAKGCYNQHDRPREIHKLMH